MSSISCVFHRNNQVEQLSLEILNHIEWVNTMRIFLKLFSGILNYSCYSSKSKSRQPGFFNQYCLELYFSVVPKCYSLFWYMPSILCVVYTLLCLYSTVGFTLLLSLVISTMFILFTEIHIELINIITYCNWQFICCRILLW